MLCLCGPKENILKGVPQARPPENFHSHQWGQRCNSSKQETKSGNALLSVTLSLNIMQYKF